ncbi:MAG TPA: hypothetical protein VJZ71_14415 [Phycisphaerae bacterium]|nr:hypothetical protein [Phycisphaerae bacterium]
MQMHRLCSVGRWMMVSVVVAVCGCAEGEWDWFGLNRPASKDKPVTKARRPVKSEPAVAEAKNPPDPAADDPKSKEVDEKVERYVQSMEPKYDPSYQNNDVTSKIQRQGDPDRAARVRQTAIRSRTEPEGNEPENVSVEAAIVEPSDESQHAAQSDSGADNGEETEGDRQEVPADQEPATPAQGKAEMAESSPPPNSEDSTAQEESATAETAMKPPVLSEVTVEPSTTPNEAGPQDGTSASPPENHQSGEINQSEAAVSNDGALASTPTERNPTGAGDESAESSPDGSEHNDAPPDQSKTIGSPAPPLAEQRSAIVEDHNATEATSNQTVRVDTTVDEPRVEVPEPKPEQAPPAMETTAREEPVASAPIAVNAPASRAAGDATQKKVRAQEAIAAANPDNVEEQFKLRMLYLVEGQDQKALAPSPGLDAETQEIMFGQLRAVQAAGMPNSPDPAIWANRQLEALEKLRGLLRSKADLLVPKVELCRAIDGFGRYEPFDPLEFKAGGKNRVLLYIEVDNFKSETTASGMYRTLLSVRESLMNKNGEELWSAKDDNIEDLARGKRRDFYLTIGPLAIPKSLAPGEYVFKVEVEDVLGGKINSNVVRFKMVP